MQQMNLCPLMVAWSLFCWRPWMLLGRSFCRSATYPQLNGSLWSWPKLRTWCGPMARPQQVSTLKHSVPWPFPVLVRFFVLIVLDHALLFKWLWWDHEIMVQYEILHVRCQNVGMLSVTCEPEKYESFDQLDRALASFLLSHNKERDCPPVIGQTAFFLFFLAKQIHLSKYTSFRMAGRSVRKRPQWREMTRTPFLMKLWYSLYQPSCCRWLTVDCVCVCVCVCVWKWCIDRPIRFYYMWKFNREKVFGWIYLAFIQLPF